MVKLFKNLKEKLAATDTLHVWVSYVLSMVVAVIFNLMRTSDVWEMIILPPVIAFILGVMGESLDGYIGTKQRDEYGVEGANVFSPKDVVRNLIGCLMAMVTLMGLLL